MADFDKLWNYGDPAATERTFRALIPQIEASGDVAMLLELQTQIARCQGLQAHFDECHLTLDGVEKRLTSETRRARIRFLLERGRAFNSADQQDKARPLFMAAYEESQAAGEASYAIDAVHMLAIAETAPHEQMRWNELALEMALREPSQHRWLPSIYNNLGEAYRSGKEYEKARDCFEKRAEWFRDRQRQPDIFNLKDIARINRLLSRTKVALTIIEPIARELEAKETPDAYISAEYGQCLAACGRVDEARPHLQRAYETLSKDEYMLKYEPEELERIQAVINSQTSH